MRSITQYNYINDALAHHVTTIKMRGSKGFTDYHRGAEFFYEKLLNLIFETSLESADIESSNTEGFDLIDQSLPLLVQVSSDSSKEKINHSLSRKKLADYTGCSFWFLFLVDKKTKYRLKTFDNPYGMKFDCDKDIYIPADLVQRFLGLSPSRQSEVFELVRYEFGREPDVARVPSILTMIVEALSEQGKLNDGRLPKVNPFEIERKIVFNELGKVRDHIKKYSVYYYKLDAIYKEYDMQASNKSSAVLSCINDIYLELSKSSGDNADLFYLVKNKVLEIVQESSNYRETPFEILSDGVYTITVDAFIRCKIFENPEGYAHLLDDAGGEV